MGATLRALSRLRCDRWRLTCWSVDRTWVVGSRRPILCVGGKEKWFARLNVGRETRAHMALREECMLGPPRHPPDRTRGASLLSPGCCLHYCQQASPSYHKKDLREFASLMNHELDGIKWTSASVGLPMQAYACLKKHTVRRDAYVTGLLGKCGGARVRVGKAWEKPRILFRSKAARRARKSPRAPTYSPP